MFHRRTLSLAWVVVLLLSPWAQALNIEAAVKQAIRSANLGPTTQVGICIRDLSTGETCVQIHVDKPLIPASNMKLLTTVAALDILSSDFTFNTTLGLIASDTPGSPGSPSLVVTGDGDPAFGDTSLLEQHQFTLEQLLHLWVTAVQKAGVTHVDHLWIDDRIFDQTFTHPDWDTRDLLKHYGAQVAGLNFHDNVIDILPIPSAYAGQAPAIQFRPEAPFLKFTNHARTGPKDLFAIHRDLGGNHLKFSGVLKHQPVKPWQITLHDPPLFFGRLLADRLGQVGISVDVVARPKPQAVLASGRVLHQVKTTLPLALTRMNQDSQNLFAEALFKRAGHAFTGEPGSWDNGAAAVRAALASRLGPRASALTIADGSGLARTNRVTPQLMVDLLDVMYHDAALASVFRDSLAYAGRTPVGKYISQGTFTRGSRFSNLPPGHWVMGKSGAMTSVNALAGYLLIPASTGRPQHLIAFSMIFNGYKPPQSGHSIKALQHQIIELVDQAIADPVSLSH